MRRAAIYLHLVGLLAGGALPVAAQESALVPLTVPDSTVTRLHCRIVPDTGTAIRVRMVIGEAPRERVFDVTYDSAGRPAAYIELASLVSDSVVGSIQSVMARFFPGGQVAGLRADHRQGQSPMPAPKQITDAEAARVKELAAWVWRRRCRGTGRSP